MPMRYEIGALVLCGAIAALPAGCATKKFVREHVGLTETKLSREAATQQSQMSQRMDTQDTKLRETSQAVDATGQRIQGLDTRVTEVGASATDAKREAGDARKTADGVATALRDTQTEFTQRLANRNKYSEVQTKAIFFDSNKADLRDEGINELR